MTNVFRIAKAVVLLAIAAFIIMVVVGVYTALDAASGYTLASSAHALGEMEGGIAARVSGVDSRDGSVASAPDGATDVVAPSVLSVIGDELGATAGQSAAEAPAGSTNNASGGSTAPNSNGSAAGNSNGGSSSGSSGATPTAPAPSIPEKTYHPAWDEWVKSGYYETKTTSATYGERSVYGSVCSECGANISGQAAQHLKATHHSGYYEGVVGTGTYEITPARSEQVWVDTSHWVHHGEYWD